MPTTNMVLCEKSEQGVAKVTLNDPETRNAMGEAMAEDFATVVSGLSSDPELRVVILTGAGQAFSGGGHLEMLQAKTKLSREENYRRMQLFYQQFLSLLDLPVPVIAAINGHAVGAGLCVALACDIRIASSAAKFGLNFVQIGLHPGMAATYFVPRVLGRARAAELLYTGKIVDAETALAYGIVGKIVSEENLARVVDETALQIAQAGPVAVRGLKQSLRESEVSSLSECLDREAQQQALNYTGEEFREGIAAAIEKRRANFPKLRSR